MARNSEDGQYRTKSDRVKLSSADRKKYKKRRDALLIGSILVFACVVAVICLNVFLKVAEIRVENEAVRYTDEQIVTASGIQAEDSLLGIRKKSVCAHIERQLPYIGEAHISVRLPDTVVIAVTYTEAKLCVSAPDGYVLLDRTGKVLQTGVAVPADYIAVVTGATLTRAVPGEKAEFEEENMFSYVTGIAQEMTRKLIISPQWYIRFNEMSLLDWDLQTIASVFGELRKQGVVDGNEVRDRIGMSPREGLSELVMLENYIPTDKLGDQKKLQGGAGNE